MAGRKSTPTPTIEQPAVDRAALDSAAQALTVVSQRSIEVSERFGDGLPYDRSRVVNEARFFMGQAAESMLEAGKRLVQIKENEPHGEFVEIVEQRLGLNVRSAQKLMQAAVKFLAPTLTAKASAPTLLGLGRTKLLELMTEDDEQLEALADGGTVAGLTLDDMQAMSSRELRKALADARQAIAAKDKVIAKKDSKLNKLAEDAERRAAVGTDEAATLRELRDATIAAEIALAQLNATVAGTLNAKPSEAAATAARHAAEYVAQRLADQLAEHGIPVDFTEMVAPAWLDAEPKAPRNPK